MGRRRLGQVPAYNLHRASGQAYVTIQNKRHYLGPHGSRISRERYASLLTSWEDSQKIVTLPMLRRPTVAQLVDRYLDARRSSRRLRVLRHQLLPVQELLGSRPAEALRVADLLRLRQHWAGKDWALRTIQQAELTLRQLYRWGIAQEYFGAEVLIRLEAAEPIPANLAPVREEVQPVPPEDVAAVLPYLRLPLCDMVTLHQLVGMRPIELCDMRQGQISREGVARVGSRRLSVAAGLWVYTCRQRKGAQRGGWLNYLLGPQAQAVLGPYLRPDAAADEHVFRTRGPLGYWTPSLYRWWIYRACRRVGVPLWGPNRLRHNVASRYEQQAGLLTAMKVIGHTSLDMTATYAEANLRDAAEIVRKIG